MKARMIWFAVLAVCFTLAAVPAMAQWAIYDNGPTDGNTDAWGINNQGAHGSITSNSFINPYCSYPPCQITGVEFVTWLYPGDVLTSVEVSITSDENGGTVYFDQVLNTVQSGCEINDLSWMICNDTANFNALSLNSGTYWLNLQNGVVNYNGDPVYWDENSGPSSASNDVYGTIPSESFTILGTNNSTCWWCYLTTPEQGTGTLLASGCMTLLGLLGGLRRKLF